MTDRTGPTEILKSCHCNGHDHEDPIRLGRCTFEMEDGAPCGCAVDLPTPDPVDDYYKPLTRTERDRAVRGTHPPYGELLNWVRCWEATVRFLETENLQLGERVVNAECVLDYSLTDEPDKVCDKRIWEANMAAHKILTEPLGDGAASMAGITPVGVDKSGELEFKIQIDHHEASIWLSREMWDAFATFWEK